MTSKYDAFLLVSFGGPEGKDDVLPFLENVLRGKNVPRERMMEVAQHYFDFEGVSPINAQNRDLIAALETELSRSGYDLPVYWGNRNWHPLLEDTLERMAGEGVERALAFVTSAYSSYSGCRQYREDIERARKRVGGGAPHVDKLRVCFNHPGFVEPNAENLKRALQSLPEDRRAQATVLFTAHSLPLSMARNCLYVEQLQETARLVAERAGNPPYQLVYQSRSGPPFQPWLEPDVCDALSQLGGEGVDSVVVAPIGFISDHMEVVYDLDTEASQHCREIGLTMVRAATVGTDPMFVSMIRELIGERIGAGVEPRSLGPLGLFPDQCSQDCCAAGQESHGRGKRLGSRSS